MDYLKDAISGFTAGLLAVAFFPFSAVLVLTLRHDPALERGIIPGGGSLASIEPGSRGSAHDNLSLTAAFEAHLRRTPS
jgi:hypothetical protein